MTSNAEPDPRWSEVVTIGGVGQPRMGVAIVGEGAQEARGLKVSISKEGGAGEEDEEWPLEESTTVRSPPSRKPVLIHVNKCVRTNEQSYLENAAQRPRKRQSHDL